MATAIAVGALQAVPHRRAAGELRHASRVDSAGSKRLLGREHAAKEREIWALRDVSFDVPEGRCSA